MFARSGSRWRAVAWISFLMSGSREQSLPFGFTDYNYLCFSRLFHAYCFHPSWFDGVCSVCWRILWSSSLQNVLFSSITCCVLDPSIFLAPCLQTFPVCIIPLRKLPNFIHVRNIQLNYCVLYILNFAIVDLEQKYTPWDSWVCWALVFIILLFLFLPHNIS